MKTEPTSCLYKEVEMFFDLCKSLCTLCFCVKNSTQRMIFVFILVCFFSCTGKKTSSDTSGKSTVVVATSSWTAAYAWAAGAEKVVTLAPFEMAHPSEYELRPSDIPNLLNAEMIIYAGYEIMTERLKKGLNIPLENLIQIETDYNLESMHTSIMKIAAKLGTERIARDNLQDIRLIINEGRKALKEKGMSGQPVVVHRFQSSVARELGLTPVLLFGSAAPEATEITAVSKTNASIIIDNFHNPVGQPFTEVLQGATYIQLLNFPGQKRTQTLVDVIRYNISQLL